MKIAHAHRATSRATAANDDRLDLVFGALANRTRRSLLGRLVDGPARVTDLAAPYDVSLNAISKHLKVLEAAGLVAREVEGRVHICAIDPHPLQVANSWLEFYRGFWSDTLTAVAAYVESGADGGQPARRRKS